MVQNFNEVQAEAQPLLVTPSRNAGDLKEECCGFD